MFFPVIRARPLLIRGHLVAVADGGLARGVCPEILGDSVCCISWTSISQRTQRLSELASGQYQELFDYDLGEEVTLEVSLAPQAGLTISGLQSGDSFETQKVLADRQQYSLEVATKADLPFDAVDLRLQFPYPVDGNKVFSQESDGGNFEPVGLPTLTLVPFGNGGATITALSTPLTSAYRLRIRRLEPGGFAKVLFFLNSWRDPRGQNILPEQRARYKVPKISPELTYIDGSFEFRFHDRVEKKFFYRPLVLGADKIVGLGAPRARPNHLTLNLIDMQ